MSIHDFLEKQRARPVRERERLAVIWTAIAFAIILVIWVVSFREMNKQIEVPIDASAPNFNDLKNNFQEGRDSIENMMQQMPASSLDVSDQPVPSDDNSNMDDSNQVPVEGSDSNGDQTNPSVPQLP